MFITIVNLNASYDNVHNRLLMHITRIVFEEILNNTKIFKNYSIWSFQHSPDGIGMHAMADK